MVGRWGVPFSTWAKRPDQYSKKKLSKTPADFYADLDRIAGEADVSIAMLENLQDAVTRMECEAEVVRRAALPIAQRAVEVGYELKDFIL